MSTTTIQLVYTQTDVSAYDTDAEIGVWDVIVRKGNFDFEFNCATSNAAENLIRNIIAGALGIVRIEDDYRSNV